MTTIPKRGRGRPPGKRTVKPAIKTDATAPKSKKIAISEIAFPVSDRPAWTIPEFCRAHSISWSFFYALRKEKRGPAEIKIGAKILISREAAAAWLRKQEKQPA